MRPPLEPGLADPAQTSNLRRAVCLCRDTKIRIRTRIQSGPAQQALSRINWGTITPSPDLHPHSHCNRPLNLRHKQYKSACPYLPNGLRLTELLARCAGTSLLLQGRQLIQVVLHMISSVGQGDQLRIQMLQENLQAKSSVTLQPGFRGTSAGKREYLLPEPPAQSGSQGREEGGGERGEGERS